MTSQSHGHHGHIMVTGVTSQSHGHDITAVLQGRRPPGCPSGWGPGSPTGSLGPGAAGTARSCWTLLKPPGGSAWAWERGSRRPVEMTEEP